MKRKKNWLCVFLALLMLTVFPVSVYGEETDGEADDKTLAPYFFVEGGDGSADSFPLKETKVTTNINGVIAETYVTQTYRNEGQTPLNARYVFPASTRVSVHGMTMEIGDKVITARIKEKEEAKQEFEQAKTEGKSASLLEQQRPNVFTMDVANVMPGDTVRIELHYTELIVSTEGVYEFVFPTVVGPRYSSPSADADERSSDAEANGSDAEAGNSAAQAESSDADQWVSSPYIEGGNTPPGAYDITVNLSTGVPITDLTCKSHEVEMTRDGESAAQVTLSNPEEYAGNRDFILDYKLTGQDVSCGLMLNTGESENYFMLMVQPPERYKPEDIPPREYIFVLDVSGSMGGYPLDTAKELIRDLVSNLKKTDSFNLILFSDTSYQMASSSLSATDENIRRALELIDRQEGGGGTELAPALDSAITVPRSDNVSRSIIVITDGYMSDEGAIFDTIGKNLDTTSFFSFGIGSSVNRYLIDGIAKTGLGEAFVVTDPSEATDTAQRFRTYIEAPILTDIHVSYEGFDAYDIEPPVISTLFAQRPIVLFGKWRGEQAGTIQITGKTGNKDYRQEIQVSDVKALEENKAISYLWARTKVERLMDYGTSEEDQGMIKKEVTDIGLKYSMMTPYTSFIAVTETVRNKDGESTDVNQPLPLPLNVSDLAVGGGYTIGSEPEDMILIIVMICIISTGFLCRRRRKGLTDTKGAEDEIL